MANINTTMKYAMAAAELIKQGKSQDDAFMIVKLAMALNSKKGGKIGGIKANITKKMSNDEIQEKSIAGMRDYFAKRGVKFDVVQKWNLKYQVKFQNGEVATYQPYQVSDTEVKQSRKG